MPGISVGQTLPPAVMRKYKEEPGSDWRKEMSHEEVRAIPLSEVIQGLGIETPFRTRKGGTEFYGKCPLHDARKNNTSFSFDSSGRYHCFSCGASGRGAIDFVKAYRKGSFQEAVEWLKTLTIPATPRVSAPNPSPVVTENPAYKATYEKYYVESSWLKERGLTQATLDYYGVGQYENPARRSAYTGKIMLPICRFDGVCVGYLARNPHPKDGEPKYVFPKGVLKSLEVFGAWNLKQSGLPLPLRVGYLVESPFCVMKFRQLGLPAVSPFGWSLSPSQVAILKSVAKGWIYLPDRNKAEEIQQSLLLLAQQCWVRTPALPPGIDDPEYLSKEQILAL